MVFYRYIDPAVIPASVGNGAYALNSLVSLLRGSTVNCCLSCFEDDRTATQIGEEVKVIPDEFQTYRKKITAALKILRTRGRFIYDLTPDYQGQKSDLACVAEQCEGSLIDHVLVAESGRVIFPDRVEVTDLVNYELSDFESRRTEFTESRMLIDDQMSEEEFLGTFIFKHLKHAKRVDICDKMLGTKFRDDFLYTTKAVFSLLAENATSSSLELYIHTGRPPGRTSETIISELREVKRGALEGKAVKLVLYELPAEEYGRELPHDRFIMTEKLVIGIGRGMDFINHRTKKNRDTTVSIVSVADVKTVLSHYSKYNKETMEI